MTVEIRIRDYLEESQRVDDVTVGEWKKKVGDIVKQDEVLLQVLIEKAVIDVPSPASGVIKEIFFREGESANMNDVIAVVEPF